MRDLTREDRAALAAARARVKELLDPAREAARIRAAKLRKERERARPQRIDHSRSKPKGGRERDADFMAWQHESGLVCIFCEIEGPPTAEQLQGERNPIEVAHQRVDGWKKGVRGHDRNSCAACRWHHQLAPNAIDKGQRQAWARIEIDPADYCQALYAAFKGGQDGRAVQRRFFPGSPA